MAGASVEIQIDRIGPVFLFVYRAAEGADRLDQGELAGGDLFEDGGGRFVAGLGIYFGRAIDRYLRIFCNLYRHLYGLAW